MEEVRKNTGAYAAYYSIPAGKEDKHNWIHSPGGSVVHMPSVRELFYRKKTKAEIDEDKQKLNDMPAGTIIRDRMYLTYIPKELHKYINVVLETRNYPRERTEKPSNEELEFGKWVHLYYVRNNIPVEMSGGKRKLKKTRRNRRC